MPITMTHGTKYPLGRQYEMHDFSMTITEDDIPECAGKSLAEKARIMQGTLIQQRMIFEAAEGYHNPAEPAFKAAWQSATKLKGVVNGVKAPK